MNRDIKILTLIILISFTGFAQVGIGTTSPDASAALDISSTDGGILFPRMTSAQRTAIVNPATSLTVFDTDTNTFWSYVASTWIQATPGVGKFVDGSDPTTAVYNDGNVAIGKNNTTHRLHVSRILDTDEANTGARIDAYYDGSGTSFWTYGLDGVAKNIGTGTIDWAIGSQGRVENQNIGGAMNTAVGSYPQLYNHGTISWGAGLVSDINNEEGTMTSATGNSTNVYNRAGASIGEVTLISAYMENDNTITGDAYGLWIGGTGAGSVGGDSYALYIATPFTNVAGNNFALYSENTADSYIEGSLGVGTTTPLQKVHINGVMRLEPQASAPTGGLGDFYVNSTDSKLYFHDGSGWREVQLAP